MYGRDEIGARGSGEPLLIGSEQAGMCGAGLLRPDRGGSGFEPPVLEVREAVAGTDRECAGSLGAFAAEPVIVSAETRGGHLTCDALTFRERDDGAVWLASAHRATRASGLRPGCR
ncbi:hypothetical protein F6B41_25505 [Microbacterium lushaniae]|nr:hypothetical protein F6B41_33835 [Microbacterium lushaniae]KAA9149511.1 hypothetical protein F6B41_25505 [Microbacterium lushaniae]